MTDTKPQELTNGEGNTESSSSTTNDHPSLSDGGTSLPDALELAASWLDNDNDNPSSTTTNTNTSTTTSSSSTTSSSDQPLDQPTPTVKAIHLLTELQHQISREALLSSNESLDDVPTSSLPLLGVEFHLGRAMLLLPTHQAQTASNSPNAPPTTHSPNAPPTTSNTSNTPSPSQLRKSNVTRSMDYFHSFLRNLERLGEGMLSDATLKEYHILMDLEDGNDHSHSSHSSNSSNPSLKMNPSQIRSLKIQRYQRKKSTTERTTRLRSLLQRRSRLGISEYEEMDGHDLESLLRSLAVETLRMYAETALEEIQGGRGELEMLEMAVRMEGLQYGQGGQGGRNGQGGRYGDGGQVDPRMVPNSRSNPPLQLTQITQNPLTGQLQIQPLHPTQATHQIQRQQIAQQIFQPSWNQPTMTLAELAEKERAEAMQRSQTQAQAEEEAKLRPRRYQQLEKDGMEDDHELVEKSAKLDREWDDWKEENPRGCGNKLKERGDRNF